jgi:hypothetical protein
MPNALGIGLSYTDETQKYLFSNASLSLNGQPLPPQLVSLDSATATTHSLTLRADAWVFPFLDMYLLGSTFEGTAKDINGSLGGQPLPVPQSIAFSGRSYGLGGTLAGKYGSLFGSYDYNIDWAWTTVNDNALTVIRHGPRAGVILGDQNFRTRAYLGAVQEIVPSAVTGSMPVQGMGTLGYKHLCRPAGKLDVSDRDIL